MRRLIFLDFDGPVAPGDWQFSDECRQLRRATGDTREKDRVKLWSPAVKQLQRIVEATGARIVISSSWRMHRHGRTNRTHLATILGHHGLRNARRRVVGITPELIGRTESGLYVSRTRWDEIRAYLESNPTDRFVIIDDEALPDAPQDCVVQVAFERGLMPDEADRAIAVLMRE